MSRMLLILLAVPSLAVAASPRVVPGDVTLTGPHATQRLIVVEDAAADVVADVTAKATFTTSAANVAAVDKAGNVRAVGDGEAAITASVGGRTATAKVRVTKTKEPFAWGFRNHVVPILTRAGCNSGACHGALTGKGGLKLSLRGYDVEADHFVLTRQALGRRIDREEPEKSLLLLKPTMALAHGGGQKVEVGSPEYKVLADWVADGAPAPKDTDARLTRLEVFPTSAMLRPKDTLHLLVRAHYSDGRSEDVTRWAKFTSSEELVAGVSPDGKVTVAGHGEAAVSVLFGTLVASATITSPYGAGVDPKLFAAAPRNNFIDGLILSKLQRLGLPPSPGCTDAEFVRRAYLDAAGILPTPAEVKAFLADRSPDKRAKLIDRLLDRPEFVDYWAYKWSDMLLITTRRLPQSAVWAFYQHVRQSVADNKPWDRFARDILTASGSNLQNGAANFFVLHKDVTDLNEATAITFMGMSLTCARCHNHPLERWTQDQYWQMANLFARVGLKTGPRGEVLVWSRPDGDAPHPRRGTALRPTPLDARPLDLDSPIDRRRHFAEWLTSPDNPYFAKALVNRVWRNYMGRGLVEAEDDIRETNPPTNAELFDALARDFVKHRYDVKQLMRTIMNSAAYQRSSKPTAGNEADDRFFSRYLTRRLSAEVILDAYSQVTGVPTPFTHLVTNARDSETPYGGFPLGTRAMQLPDSLVASRFLDAFGRPERANTCSCERSQDSSVGQALHLNNGQTLNDKLRGKGSIVEKWLVEKTPDEEAIQRLYLAALCREPTEKERASFRKLLAEASADGGRREALEDLVWAVLTSKEFVFNR
ncbi:MAG: DUF1549 and DUF1553 domain-containing protein [Gemmataceae bacterium]